MNDAPHVNLVIRLIECCQHVFLCHFFSTGLVRISLQKMCVNFSVATAIAIHFHCSIILTNEKDRHANACFNVF
jgi:hypothetical protein